MIDSKVSNSTRHLLCCIGLEEETFHLYQCVARKLKHSELRSLLVNIAYDTMKHSRTIKELLRTVETVEAKVENCRKNWQKLWNGIVEASEQFSEMSEVGSEELYETFINLKELEDCLCEVYQFLLELKVPDSLAKELDKPAQVDAEDLARIFEGIIEDKQRHKEILIEIGYRFAVKEAIRVKDSAPLVKYQNPDAWSRQLLN